MSFFQDVAGRYENELLNSIVPFWEQHSIDAEYGGFLTCLDRGGKVYDTRKFLWMQWREVYLFARLYNSPYRQERYRQYAAAGFDFLTRHGKKPDGGYYFALDRAGRPAVLTAGGAEIFTASFAAIAGAELYRAVGDARYREESLAAWKIYRADIAAAEQPPPLPGSTPGRQFGHYMIALNVLSILKSAFRSDEFDRELDFTADMALKFRNPEFGIIHERIEADGAFDLKSPEGRFTNPGHALEGMWFMLDYLRAAANKSLLEAALRIIRDTLRYGWDAEQGGIRYYRDLLDQPLGKNECMLKAWWPQCEAAIASLYAYRMSGDREFLAYFRKIDAFAWKHLRDPEFPEWFAYAAVDGRQVHSYKGSRWKGMFHLPRCLLKCIGLCQEIEAGRKDGI